MQRSHSMMEIYKTLRIAYEEQSIARPMEYGSADCSVNTCISWLSLEPKFVSTSEAHLLTRELTTEHSPVPSLNCAAFLYASAARVEVITARCYLLATMYGIWRTSAQNTHLSTQNYVQPWYSGCRALRETQVICRVLSYHHAAIVITYNILCCGRCH